MWRGVGKGLSEWVQERMGELQAWRIDDYVKDFFCRGNRNRAAS